MRADLSPLLQLPPFEEYLSEQIERHPCSEAFRASLKIERETHKAILEAEAALSDLPLLRGLAFWIFRSFGIEEEGASDLILAYEEALANSLRHAYRGHLPAWVASELAWNEADLTITIRDRGEGGRDPALAQKIEQVSKEGRPPLRHRGGLGLYLMRRLMDELRYTTDEVENRLVMCKNFSPSTAELDKTTTTS